MSIKVRHEVERDIEDDCVEDLVWHVCEHGGYSFARWVVQSVSRMLLDDWTLGVEGENLQRSVLEEMTSGKATYLKSRTESVEQDGKEKDSAPGEEAVSRLWKIVKDTADDERHHKVTEKLSDGQ